MLALQKVQLVVAIAGLCASCENAGSAVTESGGLSRAAPSHGLVAATAGGAGATPLRAILGAGSGGFVPQFLDSQTIGNSGIFQAAGGRVIIGGTEPGARLQVQDDFSGLGSILNLHQVDPTGDIALEFSQAPGTERGVMGNVGVIRSGGGPERFVILGRGRNPQHLPLTLVEDGGNIGIGTLDPKKTLDVRGDGYFSGDVMVAGDLAVSGTKSSVATLRDGRRVLLYAVESPENWFEDFGTAQLKDGEAWVPFEGVFAETVNTGSANYHVFLTPNGDCNGLYVAERRPNGFLVREVRRGRSSVGFDYRIVAPRRGLELVRLKEVQ